MGTGQLLWHLETLMKFKYINKMQFKNYTVFFPYEMANEHAICYFLLRNRINREIIKILNVTGSMRQADIPQKINESKENVYNHIETMVEEKLLIYEKNSAVNFEDFEVRLNPINKDLLIKIIENGQQVVV